jgi:hypothetical protein
VAAQGCPAVACQGRAYQTWEASSEPFQEAASPCKVPFHNCRGQDFGFERETLLHRFWSFRTRLQPGTPAPVSVVLLREDGAFVTGLL